MISFNQKSEDLDGRWNGTTKWAIQLPIGTIKINVSSFLHNMTAGQFGENNFFIRHHTNSVEIVFGTEPPENSIS